ncbi:MAG: aldehyde dehydrogenase family protein [Meiothermus sp.]|nr:aldehyde dehydrogenase family protein [Meiothermus sp.]
MGLKPDPQTTFTALWIQALMEEAGLPSGLFQIVTGGAEVGAALVASADFIALTGSTPTGWRYSQVWVRPTKVPPVRRGRSQPGLRVA